MAATDKTPTPHLPEDPALTSAQLQIDTDRERIQRAKNVRYVFVGKTRVNTSQQPNTMRDAVERAARKLLTEAG